MGAWGFGPFDNDLAADMIFLLTRPIDRALAKSVRAARYHYEEARAAAVMTLQAHATDILGGPGLMKSVRILARMRSDDEWLASWKSPRKVANALNHEMENVFLRMLTCRGCRKEAKEASRLIAIAKAVKIPHSLRPTIVVKHRLTKAQRKAAITNLRRAKAAKKR